MMQQDTDKIRRRMFEILNFVNMVYRPLHTAVVLVGLEIWKDKDQIPVVKNSGATLNTFTDWNKNVLEKIRKHDNAQLITAVQFDKGILGSAYIGTMCGKYSTGVVQDHSRDVILTAATFAHELGHNLNMQHDSSHCSCKDCIMTSHLSGGSHPRQFSSCSKEAYTSFLERPGIMACLIVNPFHRTLIPVCGNSLLEEGEQCDCGSPEGCTNPCCDATSCKFTKGAQCDKGECCKDCRFIQFTKQCRAQVDECDLPEYCTGSSAHCPDDTFLQDGTPCAHDTGYCFNGQCPNRAEQCKAVGGNDTKEAEDHCYHSNSSLHHGNSSKDAMCEMLLCTSGNKDQSNDTCTDVISPSNRSDHNQVLNGTKCGEGQVCMSNKCVELGNVYTTNNCKEKCMWTHKVCNNKQECQCEAGWIPPLCDKKYQGGLGLTQSHHPSILSKGGIIAIVVVIAAAVLALVLVKAVCFCRKRDTPISQHRYYQHIPTLLFELQRSLVSI
ncbi:zinc metalloproteinase-disintegrin bilitoxin-1-like [Alosa sapidissima]|uniref:zinc metalloproteinase-disintegrin bilitoxin-1-like n=1 Tax=Alosa sapidissima TaxID=34773 RepID=UPI001C0931B3|nr:zinc metalloproteinase-disintegrin bilitoxin-1-like [Alosa sapidissima]